MEITKRGILRKMFLKMPRSLLIRRQVQIDLAPMADMAFLVVMFMMMGSKWKPLSTIDIQYAVAQSHGGGSAHEMYISIDRYGRCWLQPALDERAFKPLPQDLYPWLANASKNSRFCIRADARTSFKHIHKVMQTLKAAGVHKVDLIVSAKTYHPPTPY